MRRKKEPCLNRFKLSEPNVEKVVNPPHSPIIKNKLKSDFIKFDFENHSKKNSYKETSNDINNKSCDWKPFFGVWKNFSN